VSDTEYGGFAHSTIYGSGVCPTGAGGRPMQTQGLTNVYFDSGVGYGHDMTYSTSTRVEVTAEGTEADYYGYFYAVAGAAGECDGSSNFIEADANEFGVDVYASVREI